MSGPTYISNTALWEQFRHTKDGKDFIPILRRNSQKRGGILNRRKAYMIPLKSRTPQQNVQLVTPVAAERERALSDLKETIRNDEPQGPLQKTKKRKKRKKSVSRTSTSKGRGCVQRKKNKIRKRSNGIKKKKSSKKVVAQRKSRRKPSFKHGIFERGQHVGC
jgi:hypothetical protein